MDPPRRNAPKFKNFYLRAWQPGKFSQGISAVGAARRRHISDKVTLQTRPMFIPAVANSISTAKKPARGSGRVIVLRSELTAEIDRQYRRTHGEEMLNCC